jgi:hypothetical protein
LQGVGLKSGLAKVGWIGVRIPWVAIPEKVSKVRVDLTKSQRRQPYKFSFLELTECEGEQIFDRGFKQ